MKPFAIMTKKSFVRNPDTKTTFIEIESKTTEIEERKFNNIENSCPWFRRLGGSETITRAYTRRGYKMVQLVSTSPDRQNKTIRTFKFID